MRYGDSHGLSTRAGSGPPRLRSANHCRFTAPKHQAEDAAVGPASARVGATRGDFDRALGAPHELRDGGAERILFVMDRPCRPDAELAPDVAAPTVNAALRDHRTCVLIPHRNRDGDRIRRRFAAGRAATRARPGGERRQRCRKCATIPLHLRPPFRPPALLDPQDSGNPALLTARGLLAGDRCPQARPRRRSITARCWWARGLRHPPCRVSCDTPRGNTRPSTIRTKPNSSGGSRGIRGRTPDTRHPP